MSRGCFCGRMFCVHVYFGGRMLCGCFGGRMFCVHGYFGGRIFTVVSVEDALCPWLFWWEDAIWLPDLSAFTLAPAPGTRPQGSAPNQGLLSGPASPALFKALCAVQAALRLALRNGGFCLEAKDLGHSPLCPGVTHLCPNCMRSCIFPQESSELGYLTIAQPQIPWEQAAPLCPVTVSSLTGQ